MKLAIVKLSALGDIVHAMVALQFIKGARPDIEIDWLVEERFAELLMHNPDIHQVLTVNFRALKTSKHHVFKEIGKIRRYAQRHYDLVIDAQGLIKSAIVARSLSRRCAGFDQQSIREKIASWFYSDNVTYPYDGNTIDRNVAVLTRPLNIEVTREQILAKQAFLFFQPPQRPLDSYVDKKQAHVLLVIGSTWPSRN
ncbi:MAG: glycosyltransferase family 9 protein, partial [Gammaproteobacteria bacterium]